MTPVDISSQKKRAYSEYANISTANEKSPSTTTISAGTIGQGCAGLIQDRLQLGMSTSPTSPACTANLSGLVFGCIEAKVCKYFSKYSILVGKLSPRSTQCTPLHRFGIESQKTRKTMGGERSWSNPGKTGQEKLMSSRNSLPSATLARELE